MHARLALCLSLLTCAPSDGGTADETWILLKRSAFVDGKLWLLTDTGKLSSIALRDREQREAELNGFVLDFCAQATELIALSRGQEREHNERWTFHRKRGQTWSTEGELEAGDDELLGLSCGPGELLLVTTRRLIRWDARGTSAVTLSTQLTGWPAVATIHATDSHLYIGHNAGEWGGGLRRVERRTGKVELIEQNLSGELCGGPLNTECDPVHAIVDSPGKPGCVIAAIGLLHLSPHGRLIEVCDTKVRRLYVKPYLEPGQSPQDLAVDDKTGEPWSSVAFFGLTRSANATWAVGIDGVYRLREGGDPEHFELPEFEQIDGISVSFALPGLILVMTEINQRHAVGGSVPLLVAR